jgi:hypothetical protein
MVGYRPWLNIGSAGWLRIQSAPTTAGIVRNTCRTSNAAPQARTFQVTTTPTAAQQRAFDLLRQIQM